MLPILPSPLELAKLLFSGVSAVSAAINIWKSTRNRQAAAQTFDATFAEVQRSPAATAAAQQLMQVAPPEIVGVLEGRAEKCWTGYRDVLIGEFLPEEIDNATAAVQACVCRELNRIVKINGFIPDRWRPQYDQYGCSKRPDKPATARVSV